MISITVCIIVPPRSHMLVVWCVATALHCIAFAMIRLHTRVMCMSKTGVSEGALHEHDKGIMVKLSNSPVVTSPNYQGFSLHANGASSRSHVTGTLPESHHQLEHV